MSEEIVTGLGRYRDLLVIAHDSSVLVSEQTKDAGEAARILGVSYALSGSVRISGNRVKITARLTEAKSRYQIWSEQYDRVLDDIFGLQEEVSQTILNMLVGNIERTVVEQSLRKDARNLSAYEFVLRGRKYFGDWTGSRDNVRRAREMFEQAIKLDPLYAAAYSGLAGVHLWEFRFKWSSDQECSATKCFENVEKAIELDPRDSFAYLTLSGAHFHIKSDFEFAKSKLQTAIELNPNDYITYCYGCLISTCSGDLDVSVDYATKARQRNPLLPDRCLWILGISEYLLNQYEDAIETFCKLSKKSPWVSACLAACYAQLGRVTDAAKAAKEFKSSNNFSDMDEKEWKSYWRKFLNFKEQEPVDHLIEGITKAKLVRTAK
jgi:adenylate cyclase